MRVASCIFLWIQVGLLSYGQSPLWTGQGTILFDRMAGFQGAALVDTTASFSIGNQSLSGAFNNIRSFYGTGNMPIDNSQVGLTFHTFQNGELIQENHFQVQMGTYIGLNPETQLGLGASAGVISQTLSSTSVIAGGADTDFDLQVSMAVRKPLWKFGASLFRITEPELQPLEQVIRYRRGFLTYSEWKVQEDFTAKIFLYHQLRWTFDDWFARIKGKVVINEWLSLGLLLGTKTLAADLGVTAFQQQKWEGTVAFAYQTPLGQDNLAQFTPFQIHLGFSRSTRL